MVVSLVSKSLTKVFGTRNDRLIKAYDRRVADIESLEPDVRPLTDAELLAKTEAFRIQIEQGEKLTSLIPQAMAVAREVMDRSVGIRAIFNPDLAFDTSVLQPAMKEVYDRVASQMAQTEPLEVPGHSELVPGWMQVEIPVEIYNTIRELHPESRPPFRARPFGVQLLGGMVLAEGNIAEMKTGEGKTIVPPLACYLSCLERMRGHVVTVNDYLVQRDRDWVFPFYYWLGLTVGAIHPFNMQPPEKKVEAYSCDVVYGTNSEFGFDYLRDNMKLSAAEQVQKTRDFVIVDEVDSILIDEARTPLIISGPAHDDAPRYGMADGVARHLMQKQKPWTAAEDKVQKAIMLSKGLEGEIRNSRDKAASERMREEMAKVEATIPELEAIRDQHIQYYEVEMEKKASHLTHEGVAEAQKVAGIGSFYVGNNMDVPHLLENALRAHVIYQRDKDYVVQDGDVVIVDEFTGRLMIGRQWSDGLHQAVETKERVKIKEETQTLATVTIQNFFKLYKRLAGMTGTAITEATEFNEVYRMDVVCIPTNKPVIRHDQEDIIYLSGKDKWTAILDDIKLQQDIGRPVLVGTTSVESSERLSQMLTRRDGIKHEVLNAKQHEREALIVESAGALGAVMIATNMAGRGTDIRLRPIPRENLIRHWQQRDLLTPDADVSMTDDQIVALVYRRLAQRDVGLSNDEMKNLSDKQVRRKMLEYWVGEYGWRVQWHKITWWQKVLLYKYFTSPTWHDTDNLPGMSDDELMAVLDCLPQFQLHRLEVYPDTEAMGGLHIIGTERHESRRIDNQLRGRAGRQGNQGSSRFFISLEDNLMSLFAGKTTLAALSKLGMKEGDAIEHRWLTKSVERAQRKVEERNYEIRKNLLEYDEVMEHQRNAFYGIRQEVLEGYAIDQMIFDYIYDAIDDAVNEYLHKDYVRTQIAEWCRQTLDISVDPSKLHTDDLVDLQAVLRKEASAEAAQIIDVTLGEYMSNDLSPDQWDLRGLSSWAMSRFQVDLKQNQLRQMNIEEVKLRLTEIAIKQVGKRNLAGVSKFLDPLYAPKQLADWAQTKFSITLDPQEIDVDNPNKMSEQIFAEAQKAYEQREVDYPVDFILEMTHTAAQQDGPWAAEHLCRWAKNRFDLELKPEEIFQTPIQDIHKTLIAEGEKWIHGNALEQAVDQGMAEGVDPATWFEKRFGQTLDPKHLAGDQDPRDVLIEQGKAVLRTELTELERFVLLQILDMAWKDHLYAMDQLKDAVGLRGYAEKDPRLEYKREGANQFAQMQQVVRNRVTDLIFRARLTAEVEHRSVYGQGDAKHEDAADMAHLAATSGTSEQRANLQAAEHIGGHDDDALLTRKQRRARAAQASHESTEKTASSGQKYQKSRPRRRRRR